ncbi:AraC family transcriptional regulator [Labrenzia sp. VG12]|uniref:helix-turn-helix transcriptional regulator n=1 Tax=Labrenzia sp. VG12 TaxID=2021862 RepID=UPI000B8C630C|nr:AraC family transcriptional regulator [Labrenzia sp. VG12]ASP36134.1 AraC family transcriptional regulator [Labrenzia sp. VG12]
MSNPLSPSASTSRPHRIDIAGHRLVLLSAAAYDVAFVATRDTIGFAFDGQTGSHAIASDRSEPFCRRPNSVALTPRGCEVRSRSAAGGEYLQLSGNGISFEGEAYRTNLMMAAALPVAAEMRRWFLTGKTPDPLLAEAGLARLTTAVSRPQSDPKAARWMTPMRFRRLTDHIEADLDTELTVAGLARCVGVSPSFLSRAFSAFCGQSPYDYIVSRRLQRARRLISETQDALADIAVSCGFSSQSHMTSLFRRRLGISPGRLERPGKSG